MTSTSMELTVFEIFLGTVAENNWKQKTGEVRPILDIDIDILRAYILYN